MPVCSVRVATTSRRLKIDNDDIGMRRHQDHRKSIFQVRTSASFHAADRALMTRGEHRRAPVGQNRVRPALRGGSVWRRFPPTAAVVRAGVVSVLNGLTGIVVWLD